MARSCPLIARMLRSAELHPGSKAEASSLGRTFTSLGCSAGGEVPRERCHQHNRDLQGGERQGLSSAWHFHSGAISFLASNLASTSTTEPREQGTARSGGWRLRGTTPQHKKPPGEVQRPIPPKPKLTGAKIHPRFWRQQDRAPRQETGLLCLPAVGKAELPAPSQCHRAAR